jgi:hypothetical protein
MFVYWWALSGFLPGAVAGALFALLTDRTRANVIVNALIGAAGGGGLWFLAMNAGLVSDGDTNQVLKFLAGMSAVGGLLLAMLVAGARRLVS